MAGPCCPLPGVLSSLWLVCFRFCWGFLWWPAAGPELGLPLSRQVSHLPGMASRAEVSLSCSSLTMQGGELTATCHRHWLVGMMVEG